MLTPANTGHCWNKATILFAREDRDDGVLTAKEKFVLKVHPPIANCSLNPPFVAV